MAGLYWRRNKTHAIQCCSRGAGALGSDCVAACREGYLTTMFDVALPLELDLDVYRDRNPDLAEFSDADAVAHYATYGAREGRTCSAVASRSEFVRIIPQAARVLEIGPAAVPTIAPRIGVKYLDVLTKAENLERARALNWGDQTTAPEIDFLWRGEPYASFVDERFSVAYSAHCIEHQPCLVTHLQDVASILEPGGFYFLTVPDRRYCFDHFLGDSTIAEIADAYKARRRRHTLEHILEHRVLVAHNDPIRHWDGDHGPDPRESQASEHYIDRMRAALGEAESDDYIDVHAWKFTPRSLRHVFALLEGLGWSPFCVRRLYSGVRYTNEFHVVLQTN